MSKFAAALAVIVGIFALTVFFGSWYTVDQGYRGVILRNGALVGIAEPGLGFKVPIVDTVRDISVQENVVKYDNDQGGLSAYSRDQQEAHIRISVNYRIPSSSVGEVYSSFGSEDNLVDRILTPRVMQQTKNVFGQFNAVSAIQDRTALNSRIFTALQQSIVESKAPLVVTGVQVENIDFSDIYEKSIEERMTAEVEVQKLHQNAEREKVQAEITVTKAKAAADAIRAEAEAKAEAIRITGEAQASAIRARSQALGDNPNLIALTQAEKWNGILPSTMLPGGAVPFIDVNANK